MIAGSRNLYTFSSHEISGLFKKAKRIVRRPECDVLAYPRKYDYARLLPVAPRKLGNAPTRNKIKRRLKAIFYEHKLYEKAYDFIFIAKPNCLAYTYQELEALLLKAIS